MDAEPFPLKYDAKHDRMECYCRVIKRPWLRRKAFRMDLDGLKYAREHGLGPGFRVVEVEEGRLFWVVSPPCQSKECEARPIGHSICGGWDSPEQPSRTSSRPHPSRGSSHWSGNPGRIGGGGFMG
ncbi:hypothetical protein [Streptomyces wedmorensis]